MKCLTWNLCTITLTYVPRSHLGFYARVKMFKRKARIVVRSNQGRYVYTCTHRFPTSWEDFYRLFNQFRAFIINGPPLWTKLVHHPRGLCMSLSESLFRLENDSVNTIELPDKHFYFQLVLNTNLITEQDAIKGRLTITKNATSDLSKYTHFSVPPLVVVLHLIRSGYCLKVVTDSKHEQHEWLIRSADDVLSLMYLPKSVLWVCSVTFTPCYVPVLQLTKRNLKGIKYLVREVRNGRF